jgi:hypothetical protein
LSHSRCRMGIAVEVCGQVIAEPLNQGLRRKSNTRVIEVQRPLP